MRRLGLRARVVAITAGLLAVVLAIGAVTLALVVLAAQRSGLDAELRRTADQVAVLVAQDTLPATLPVSGARLVQVVDGGGAVVSASLAADRLTPLLSATELASARGGAAVEVPATRLAETGTLRAVAVPAGPQSRGLTVLAASPIEAPSESQRGLWLGLGVGVPLLVAIATALLWQAVGAALRPVDALRAGAERIGAGDDESARLPVPPGQDEIRSLALTLNGMLDRLQDAADGQRRFVADAAHELRSPVASLRMQVEVAQRVAGRSASAESSSPSASSASSEASASSGFSGFSGFSGSWGSDPLGSTGSDPDESLAAELAPDVERLARLVDDLLLLARAGSPRSTHRPEEVDVTRLLADLVQRYAQARVPVHLQAPAEPVVADLDRAGLQRAVANLVDNATRHAREQVTLRVRTEAGRLLIEVVDDGDGIPADQRERVFDRFTRLDDARDRDAGGSGLGLAIARELARRDGGEITLHEAEPGLLARLSYAAPRRESTGRGLTRPRHVDEP